MEIIKALEPILTVLLPVLTFYLGHRLSTRASQKAQQTELRGAADRQGKELEHRNKVARFEAYASWFHAVEEFRLMVGDFLPKMPGLFGKEERQDEWSALLEAVVLATQKLNIAKNVVLLWEHDKENRREVDRIHSILAPVGILRDKTVDGVELAIALKYEEKKAQAFDGMRKLVDRIAGASQIDTLVGSRRTR